MKLVLDEKLKHRLIGLAVVISLGAIFAPAVMKKSSQHSDGNFSVNVKLPPKPVAPNVSATDEQDMFKTIKVARVNVADVPADKQLPELVKAESIKSNQVIDSAAKSVTAQAAPNSQKDVVNVALAESVKATKAGADKAITIAANQVNSKTAALAVKPKVVAQAAKTVKNVRPIAAAKAKPALKQNVYALQLASFAKITNAQALVTRLNSKGYKATYAKQNGIYKVYAGHSPRKNEVLKLKSQLASSMQLNGFVVTTGVS